MPALLGPRRCGAWWGEVANHVTTWCTMSHPDTNRRYLQLLVNPQKDNHLAIHLSPESQEPRQWCQYRVTPTFSSIRVYFTALPRGLSPSTAKKTKVVLGRLYFITSLPPCYRSLSLRGYRQLSDCPHLPSSESPIVVNIVSSSTLCRHRGRSTFLMQYEGAFNENTVVIKLSQKCSPWRFYKFGNHILKPGGLIPRV